MYVSVEYYFKENFFLMYKKKKLMDCETEYVGRMEDTMKLVRF